MDKRVPIAVICCLSLASCFQEEAPNTECDILTASLHADDPMTLFYNASDTLQVVASADSVIDFPVRMDADLHALSPVFTLTEGATVTPANGSEHDFSHGGVTYTVTSEDHQWHRDYHVTFTPVRHTVSDTTRYDFEDYSLEPSEQKYYVWQQPDEDGQLQSLWASGNGGFRLSMGSAAPDEYPTAPLRDGYDGSAVCLTTRSTGPFGEIAGKRIAAGNLFLGSFDVTTALLQPLHATRFGVVFDQRPVTFTGYYQYQPGESYQDENGRAMPGVTDSAAVYAVFYRNHDSSGNSVPLYGDDVKTNPRIIAIADMGYVAPTNTWTAFSVAFRYTADIDWQLLADRGYNLAIVFSSSSEGDKFRGAVGSRLLIDKVSIIGSHEQ